jgi:hypothetical protein
LLLDDLDDASCPRFNQNRAAIHYRVPVLAYTILRRDVVIGDTFFRKYHANSYVLAILIRGASLFDDIGTEAGTLVHAENTVHAADDATDHASNNRSNRTISGH